MRLEPQSVKRRLLDRFNAERLCLFVGASLLAPDAGVRLDPGAELMTLAVGESRDVHRRASGIVCDDRSIVKVEDAGDHLRFTGLGEGRTLCGLKGPRGASFVYEVVVRERSK
jgi:hypothetical protein